MRVILFLLLGFIGTAFGQNATKHTFNFSKASTVNLAETTDDWDVNVQHLEAPKPGVPGLRAELMVKKQEIMARYPKSSSAEKSANSAASPTIGQSFEGNQFNGIPNDNDIAISRDGKIMSVTNSRIYVFDSETQEELLYKSLHIFCRDALGILGSKYDPKVVYDPNNDRFVVVFLNGYTWESSQIIIGFSQTSDPTGEWNLYALPGNPLNNESWSDYPVIGISGKDLYIGMNTFLNGSENNSGFVETCLWQIGLKEGYIGFDLTTNYYSDILPQNKPIFNICPISAAAESEDQNMYLLSNRNTDTENDTIFLLEVTGRATDPNTELIVSVIHTDQPYVLPVPAEQPGSQILDTNDGRILGGYMLNGRIYYVQACTDPANGRAAIYHGVINDIAGTPSIVSRIYSDPNLDYGYPNISWTGQSVDDEQSIINFNHSGESHPAGFSALHIDENLVASDRIEIRPGITPINVLQGDLERWGDYSGSQRMFNEPGVVWAVGTFGKSNAHGTWIAELRSPDVQTSINDEPIQIKPSIFPNPFANQIAVKFELEETMILRLELFDSNGKLVQVLLEDRMKTGLNQVSFNGELLTSGTYLLVGSSNNSKVFSKTVIKQ